MEKKRLSLLSVLGYKYHMICVDQFFNNLSGGLLSEVIDIQPPLYSLPTDGLLHVLAGIEHHGKAAVGSYYYGMRNI